MTSGENSMFGSPSSGLQSGEVGEVAVFHLFFVGDGVLGVCDLVDSKVKVKVALAKAEVTPENLSSTTERSSTLLAFDKDGLGLDPNENKLPVFKPDGIQLLLEEAATGETPADIDGLDVLALLVVVVAPKPPKDGKPVGTAKPSFLGVSAFV